MISLFLLLSLEVHRVTFFHLLLTNLCQNLLESSKTPKKQMYCFFHGPYQPNVLCDHSKTSALYLLRQNNSQMFLRCAEVYRNDTKMDQCHVWSNSLVLKYFTTGSTFRLHAKYQSWRSQYCSKQPSNFSLANINLLIHCGALLINPLVQSEKTGVICSDQQMEGCIGYISVLISTKYAGSQLLF